MAPYHFSLMSGHILNEEDECVKGSLPMKEVVSLIQGRRGLPIYWRADDASFTAKYKNGFKPLINPLYPTAIFH